MKSFLVLIIFVTLTILSAHAFADEVIIGAEDDAAPWSYKNGTGYANDVVREAFKASGVTIKFNVYPYARCKSMAEKGLTLACFTTSKNSLTNKNLLFPKNPLIYVRNSLFVRKGNGIKSCDIKKWPRPLSVIAVNEYEYIPKFTDYIRSGVVKPVMVNTEAQALHMLHRKRADVIIVNIDEVKTIEYLLGRAKLSSSLELACDLGVEKGFLAFSKKYITSKEMMEKFDRGYEIIKKNGTLKNLQTIWSERALENTINGLTNL